MINNLFKVLSISRRSVINNQSTVYYNNKQNSVGLGTIKFVTTVLTSFFKGYNSLIGIPKFDISTNSVKIHLCYYRATNLTLDEVEEKLALIGVKGEIEQKKVNSEIKKRIKAEDRAKLIARLIRFKLYRSKWDLARFKAEQVKETNKRIKKEIFSDLYKQVTFKLLIVLLSEILKTNVELKLVRLNYPYSDSHILAQLINIHGKTQSFNRIKKYLFQNSTINTEQRTKSGISNNSSNVDPSTTINGIIKQINQGQTVQAIKTVKREVPTNVTGIRIRVSGRLAKQRVVPKRTVRNAYKGGITNTRLDIIESSQITGKNKRGAYCIKVWVSHGIKNEIKNY